MHLKQYKHILVPLDMSKLAELALPEALTLARLNQAELTLLHVITPSQLMIATYPNGSALLADQLAEAQRQVGLDYLAEVRGPLLGEGVIVHTALETGLPADAIIDYAQSHQVDLIVMSTHGRSGLKRWVYGSVAGKVLRGAHVPVVLVRAHQEQLLPA
jgi:nucleotide-binding universal stress UspA family protein